MAKTKYSKQHLNTVLRIIRRDATATRNEVRKLWRDYNLGRIDVALNQSQFDSLGDLDTYTERAVVAVKRIKAAAR